VLAFLIKLLSLLPLAVLRALGGALGALAYRIAPKYRNRIREHLAQAGYDPDALGPAAAREAGKQALELPWAWGRSAEQIRARIEIANPEVEQAALDAGRPLIYLTPHFGCFEMASHYCALTHWRGARSITVMYRIPRQDYVHDIVRNGRTRLGAQLATADLRGVRTLLRALKRGDAVGILPDQVPGEGEGVWAPFFGRPAYTMTLPGKLAAASGATVLFIVVERARLADGRAGFRVHFAPVSAPLTGDGARDAAQVNAGLERVIRIAPAQYLWSYNRYKRPAGAPPPPEALL
jgi:KDO2-lipid IV(A) lauroyltransferase